MAGRLLDAHFKRHSDFAVVSCAADKGSLLSAVRETKPNVAIISADLQDGLFSGIAALREILKVDPGLRSILLFDRPEAQPVLAGLRAGARGIFPRCDFDFAALRKCVHRVFEGQLWVGNTELQYVVDALAQAQPLRLVNSTGLILLSRREEAVMRLVAEGLGNRQIADQLALSENTVKNYLFHIFDKLGVSNRVELVLYAMSNPKTDSPAALEQEGNALSAASGRGAQRYA